MFDNDPEELEQDRVAAARSRAEEAKESTKEKLGPRAVDGIAQAFPEEFRRRQRTVAAKAFGVGLVAGAILTRLVRRD